MNLFEIKKIKLIARLNAWLNLIVTTIIVTLSMNYAFGGGANGGGGNTCYIQEKAVLLDFSTEIKDDDGRLFENNGVQISTSSRAMAMIGYDVIDLYTGQTKSIIEKNLSRWQRSSPKAVKHIYEGLNAINFVMVPTKSTHLYKANLTENNDCKSSNVFSVFKYEGVNAIAVGSTPHYNAMSLWSQAGALVHEALRYTQLTLGYEISDKDIQSLTHQIFYGFPTQNNSLDLNPIFAGVGISKLNVICSKIKSNNDIYNYSDKNYSDKKLVVLGLREAIDATCGHSSNLDQTIDSIYQLADRLNLAINLNLIPEENSYFVVELVIANGDFVGQRIHEHGNALSSVAANFVLKNPLNNYVRLADLVNAGLLTLSEEQKQQVDEIKQTMRRIMY